MEKTMIDPKPYLEKDFALNADMLDALMDEKTKILYSEEDGVMLRIEGNGPYAISAATSEAMTKMAKLIEEEHFGGVVRPFRFLPEFFAVKGKMGMMPCYQTVYASKEILEEKEVPGIEIKPLTEEQLRFVCDNYDDDEEYIKSRIEYGMLGAFNKDGECVGFIGFHGEGSMGLLTVLPEYRRKGIGEALETKNINRRVSEGRIPYGHVVVGNEKSLGLQRKRGMTLSENLVTWVFNGW